MINNINAGKIKEVQRTLQFEIEKRQTDKDKDRGKKEKVEKEREMGLARASISFIREHYPAKLLLLREYSFRTNLKWGPFN